MPDVSVIIPTYNRARYIGAAIDSVLDQTCKDVEIVVVDDGSTDDTRARLDAYGDRIQYIRTDNRGVAHARNVGMRAAAGEYLAFLDSDDMYYPYALELKKRVLDRYPELALVYAEMSQFDDHGAFEEYALQTYHSSAYRDSRITYDRIFTSQVPLRELDVLPAPLAAADGQVGARRFYFGNIFDWYLTSLVVFQNSAMFRRRALAAVGERNERVRHWQEMEYILRIARQHPIGFVDVPTYKLRCHEGQVSTTVRRDGRYVWMRKQQILLRVTRHHAHADRGYYDRHRRRIDAHLANLHRAVAVPMMLIGRRDVAPRHRYARVARLYLERCRRLGHAQWLLWMLTFAPPVIRRTGVSIVTLFRERRHDLRRDVIPTGAAS